MYAGTDNAIWKYTFNYKGENNGLVVNNLVAAATKYSSMKADSWGSLSDYGIEGLKYDTDSNGNKFLKLDGNDVANMAVNQKVEINKRFSVNITVKGDTENQYCETSSKWNWPGGYSKDTGGAIFAISDEMGKYLIWTSVLYNKLRVIAFGDKISSKSIGVSYINDISTYDENYMNIQITAERSGLTKVYINGQLKLSFNSGSGNYSYNNLCIGDLRIGRGLKYIGNVYNFALYGDILTEEEITQNWNYVKNELGIN